MLNLVTILLVLNGFSFCQTYHRMKKNYDNGMLKEIGTYTLSNEKLVLVKKTYFYDNGKIKEEKYKKGEVK